MGKFKCDKIVCLLCFIVFVIIAGIILIPYSESIRYTPPERSASRACFDFPSKTSHLKLKKNVEFLDVIWRWSYDITAQILADDNSTYTIKGEFDMRYPTFNNDLDAKMGSQYVGRTDGKSFSTVSEIDIEDCHGKVKYIMKAGSFFDAFINNFNIEVSLSIVANGKTIYYVDKDNLFVSDIYVKNAQKINVAHLHHDKYTDIFNTRSWTWTIDILDPINNPIDPLILISIAGAQSFQEKDSEGNFKTDMPNGLYITLIVLFSIIGCLCLCGCGVACYDSNKHLTRKEICEKMTKSISDCAKEFSKNARSTCHKITGYGSLDSTTSSDRQKPLVENDFTTVTNNTNSVTSTNFSGKDEIEIQVR